MEARFVACFALVLAACLNSAVGTGQQFVKVADTVMPATPAVYKVVDPTPATLQYQIVAPEAQTKVEEVRRVVAGPAPGCSITSCSQVTSGCGWCTKDGGYAVGYEKNVETLADRKRTTLTLKKECKGVFVFEASKCPSPVVAPKATGPAISPKATAPSVLPTPKPTAPVVPAMPVATEPETVLVVEEPTAVPVEVLTATPVHYSHGHPGMGHPGMGHPGPRYAPVG